MKVLIATGGTGGHIYPAISLADYLAKNYKDNSFMFVGNADRMESTIIPQLGYRFLGIEAAKFNGADNKIKALKTLYKSGCIMGSRRSFTSRIPLPAWPTRP